MNKKKFAEAVSMIDDKYYAEAENYQCKKMPVWLKWSAAAACLCLIIAGIFRIAIGFIPGQMTDIFREGSRYEIESVYDLPAAYDGKILIQNLVLSDSAAVEFYYKEGGSAADTDDWYSLIVADRQSGGELLIHCMFGDTTVDDWKVSSVFTKDSTQAATINGVNVQLARLKNSLEYEYWYYAIFEYDDVVYDVRVKSNEPGAVYDVLNQLLSGSETE